MKQKGTPKIKCFFVQGQAKFYCPYCQHWHVHGSDTNGNFEGYRTSHCHTEDSKFRETGYCLKKYTITELKQIKQWVESSLKHRGK